MERGRRPLGRRPRGPDRVRGQPDGRRLRPGRPESRLRGRQERGPPRLRQELGPDGAPAGIREREPDLDRVRRQPGDRRRRGRAAGQRRRRLARRRVRAGAARSCPRRESLSLCGRRPSRRRRGRRRPRHRDRARRPHLAVAVLGPAAAGIDRDRRRRGADRGRVRAIVSVVPRLGFPPADDIPEPDPNAPPPILPPFPSPGDGYLLRETATGWEDEERTAFAGTGEDRPEKSDPVLSLLLDPSGNGWAVGGWSGDADSAGRGTSARNATARLVRERVRTATIFRPGSGGSARRAPRPAARSDAGRFDTTRGRRPRRVRLLVRRPGAPVDRARPDPGRGPRGRRRDAGRGRPPGAPLHGQPGPVRPRAVRRVRATPNSSAASRACRSIRRSGPTTSPVATGSPPSSRPSPRSRRRSAAAPPRVASRPPGSPARPPPPAPAPTMRSTASGPRAPCGSS